jgi:HlyD family secretion protein
MSGMRTRILSLSPLALILFGLVVVGAWRGALPSFSRETLPSESAPASAGGKEGASFDGEEAGPGALPSVPLPVTGVVIRRGSFVLEVHATGRVEAVRRAELSSRVGERVRQVRVEPGRRVRGGDVLVELDSRPFELSLHEAEAVRGRAELAFESQVFSDPEVSETRRQRIADRVGLTEARQKVARAELDLEGTVLRAPFAGEVAAVSATVGERVQADRPLVTLVAVDPVRVPAQVLEADFGRLRVGAPVTVKLSSLAGASISGTIGALGPEIDPERGIGVAYIDLPNPEGRIRPGMFTEVTIAAELRAERLSVPREALLERDRRSLVFRVKQGRAEWSYVETGLENDHQIEILSGIADGDTVLVRGHLTLAHGAAVRVAVEE